MIGIGHHGVHVAKVVAAVLESGLEKGVLVSGDGEEENQRKKTERVMISATMEEPTFREDLVIAAPGEQVPAVNVCIVCNCT